MNVLWLFRPQKEKLFITKLLQISSNNFTKYKRYFFFFQNNGEII